MNVMHFAFRTGFRHVSCLPFLFFVNGAKEIKVGISPPEGHLEIIVIFTATMKAINNRGAAKVKEFSECN